MMRHVFISYAEEDESLREELSRHLSGLRREGLIADWHHRKIDAGEAWRDRVDEELNQAHLVMLLISADFLASDYCFDVEMRRALERHEAGDLVVVPVLVRSCDFRRTPFAKLRPLPTNEIPVVKWRLRDDAWLDVVAGVRAALALVDGSASDKPSPTTSTLNESALRAEGIVQDLKSASERRDRLEAAGKSTATVDAEILELRRRRRQGWQLRRGDELGGGRYLIDERIGRGGFATVWGAVDRRSGGAVAIKVLHPQLADDAERRERFFRGARIMSKLDHPNVVSVLELMGEDQGFHYFVMKRASGGDLRRAVLEGRIPKRAVIPMVLEVGDALVMAHARGFVHRDVKPANVLLDERGKPLLTDFDLVGAPDSTGGTGTGALGTFLYAAPEVMTRPQDADARADVYGLAMTAVFCLYGRELPYIVMRDTHRFLAELGDDAPVAVLERALSWEAEERFSSMAVFCEALLRATQPGDARAGRDTRTRAIGAPPVATSPPLAERPPYSPPRYRPRAEAFYHFLYGSVPGHHDDFIYCPEIPHGALVQNHFGHLYRLIQIEPRGGASYAFAIGNLSRDDVQLEVGHGGIAIIFAARVVGTVDHEGRPSPLYSHAAVAVDRQLDFATLLEAISVMYRSFSGGYDDVARWGTFYRAYVRVMHEHPEHVEELLTNAISELDAMPIPPASTFGFDFDQDDAYAARQIILVHDDDEPFESLATWAALLASVLYRSDIKWTSITTGREPEIPGGTTIRFVPLSEAPIGTRGPRFDLRKLPDNEDQLAALLFQARRRIRGLRVERLGWRERLAEQGRALRPSSSQAAGEPSISSSRPPVEDGEGPGGEVDDQASTLSMGFEAVSDLPFDPRRSTPHLPKVQQTSPTIPFDAAEERALEVLPRNQEAPIVAPQDQGQVTSARSPEGHVARRIALAVILAAVLLMGLMAYRLVVWSKAQSPPISGAEVAPTVRSTTSNMASEQ